MREAGRSMWSIPRCFGKTHEEPARRTSKAGQKHKAGINHSAILSAPDRFRQRSKQTVPKPTHEGVAPVRHSPKPSRVELHLADARLSQRTVSLQGAFDSRRHYLHERQRVFDSHRRALTLIGRHAVQVMAPGVEGALER